MAKQIAPELQNLPFTDRRINEGFTDAISGRPATPHDQLLVRLNDQLIALRQNIESLRADNAHLRREFETAWPDAQRYQYVVHTADRHKIVPLFESGYTDAEIEALIDKMRSEK